MPVSSPYRRFSGARAYDSAGSQVLTAVTTAAILFNSERFDTDGYHSTSSNTSRMTVPVAGYYLISGSLGFPTASGVNLQLFIRLNGTTNLNMQSFPGDATYNRYISLNTTYQLAAGDYVEMCAQASSGLTLLAASGNNQPEFAIALLGV